MINNKKGFTLLEILIVIVILGIASTFTFLALGDFGLSRRARVEAEQFVAIVKVVQQQAILEIDTFGISINKNGYQIYRFEPLKGWVLLNTSRTLRAHNFPAKIHAYFASSLDTKPNTPQIIINPSGDMTTFQLYFGTRANPKIVLLTGKHNGDLTLNKGELNES